MNEVSAISAVSEISTASAPTNLTVATASIDSAAASSAVTDSFRSLVSEGIANIDSKVAHADEMVAQFAIDSATPIHHVTVALEEARLAVELGTHVRQRVTEGYRELMNMQL